VNKDRVWALVPLRQLAGGKERLAGVLEPGARQALVEAMAADVVAALLAVPLPPQQVLLVSADPAVRAMAAHLGVGFIACEDEGPDPLNGALTAALRHAAASGAGAVLILHADLPRATPGSLEALLAAGPPAPSATLVPDAAGTGSNCLLLSPPGAMPLAFGTDSRARHRAGALACGIDFREFPDENLGFDVDFPADLARLVNPPQTADNAAGEHTRAWIRERQAAVAR
jgi:2-phospho-L-lactate guanylyltransferase